jgi:hypothetical protein
MQEDCFHNLAQLLASLRPMICLPLALFSVRENRTLLKRNLQLAIGFAISAVFIYMALPGLHFREVLVVAEISQLLVAPAGHGCLFRWAMGAHMALALHAAPIKPVPIVHALPAGLHRLLRQQCLPFRAGEVLRSYLLKREEEHFVRLQPDHRPDRTHLSMG